VIPDQICLRTVDTRRFDDGFVSIVGFWHQGSFLVLHSTLAYMTGRLANRPSRRITDQSVRPDQLQAVLASGLRG
jgi:hypothetical protein